MIDEQRGHRRAGLRRGDTYLWGAVLSIWSACGPDVFASRPGPEPTAITASQPNGRGDGRGDGRSGTVTIATVVLHPPERDPVRVRVEVVRTWPDIERGLKYRHHLPADRGMLFLMGQEEEHSFWMRDTLIALDMLFIGRDMRVVGIIERAEPLTDESRTIGKPSLYVLEVNAGWAATHGVVPGTMVRFAGVESESGHPRTPTGLLDP